MITLDFLIYTFSKIFTFVGKIESVFVSVTLNLLLILRHFLPWHISFYIATNMIHKMVSTVGIIITMEEQYVDRDVVPTSESILFLFN